MGDEDVLADEFIPEVLEVLTPDVDLAHPVSLKEITKAATEKLERDIILKALEANGGNRRKTARWLNISYRSLLYKLGRHIWQAIPSALEGRGSISRSLWLEP